MVTALQPYAKALFETAVEEGKEEAVQSDLEQLDSLTRANPDFCLWLKHPGINREEKAKDLDRILAGCDPLLARFLSVLTMHGMAGDIPDLLDAWKEESRLYHHVETVIVETPAQLSKDETDRLEDMLKKRLGTTPELDIRIVPERIAGLRVKARDFILDNSIGSRLESMKEQLVESR